MKTYLSLSFINRESGKFYCLKKPWPFSFIPERGSYITDKALDGLMGIPFVSGDIDCCLDSETVLIPISQAHDTDEGDTPRLSNEESRSLRDAGWRDDISNDAVSASGA